MKMKRCKPLSEEIPYRKVIWIFGFTKTIISTTLLTTGIALIIDGFSNHLRWQGYNQTELNVGVFCIVLGVSIIALIDSWKQKQKRIELDTIDNKMDEKVNQLAKIIAEEKVLQYLKEIKDEK